MKQNISPALIKIFLLVCLCFAFPGGCTKPEPPSSGDRQKPAEEILHIGLIPERNIFEQMDRYRPFTDYVFEKTGTRMELKVLTRYGNVIDNFVSLHLDGAFFGSFTYTLAHLKLGVEPLARPENADGVSTYYGLIFVRKDSGIKTAKDMKGKIFAFVDKATTAGYLLPLAYFKENGIGDYRLYLKETYFAGTHEDAIYDVIDGKADIGAVKNTVYNEKAKTDKRIEEELVVLARSPDVPENGLAVRKDLNPQTMKKLKETLLNMHNDEAGRKVLDQIRAKRFIETRDADYKAVYDYMKAIGLDLSSYDYANNK